MQHTTRGPVHISAPLSEIEHELDEARRRHPAFQQFSARVEELLTERGWHETEDGWTQVHPNVIYFEQRDAG